MERKIEKVCQTFSIGRENTRPYYTRETRQERKGSRKNGKNVQDLEAGPLAA
jgi:hypothetical protein